MKVLRICFLVLFCLGMASSIGVYAQRIGSPYRMPPRIQTQQTQQTQESQKTQETKGAEAKPAEPPRYKRTRTEPRHTRERRRSQKEVQGSLRQRGKKLYLRTNQSVKKVEVFAENKKLGELKKGNNFDITKYLSQAQRNQLKFIYHNLKGETYLQTLSTQKYKSLAMPPEPLDKGSSVGMPIDPLKKGIGTAMPPDPLEKGLRGMPVDPYGKGGTAMPIDPLGKGPRAVRGGSVMVEPGGGPGGHVAPHAVGGLSGRGGVSMEEEEEEEEEEPVQTRPNPMQRLFNFFRGRRGVAQQGVSSMGTRSASSGAPTGPAVPGSGPVSWDPTDRPQGSTSWDPGEMPQNMEEMEQMGR